jgi:hypothetical protein
MYLELGGGMFKRTTNNGAPLSCESLRDVSGNLPVFALACAKPLQQRQAVLAETLPAPRAPRIRCLINCNHQKKMPPQG